MSKGMKMLLAAGVLVLAGCSGMQRESSGDAQSVPSVQEISLEAADKECRERAVAMTSRDDRPWFGSGWQQQSYYEWCMEDKGYSREEYKRFLD